ncbi:MAG: hypothetical protein J6B50_05725 [Lachnospiraceae bacterium]|nr:hypothetical protein [Lachnospiraceae bacterium]
MANLYGVSAYQQTNQTRNQSTKKKEEVSKNQSASNSSGEAISKTDKEIKISTWSPISTGSPLVPSYKDGVGMSIGDIQLSDKAKEYYSKLKAKFGNMEFIAVSQDMKSQVQANVAAYGNANKQVVLIDDAKLEQMANDESYRKKYEGIIAMSQSQLANAKNSLASSGASIKNFGMSVNSDGSTSFFATLEKSTKDQAKRIEKKQAEKKAAKAKEKKQAEKKAKEERLEKSREEQRAKQEELKNHTDKDDDVISESENKEYIEIKADSIEDLISQVSKYAYDNSAKTVMTEEEKTVGQNFDFKG